MPGPEGAPPPRTSAETYTSDFTMDEAGAALGRERAHARTALSDKKEGYLDPERHADELTANERAYRAAVVSDTTREARKLQEELPAAVEAGLVEPGREGIQPEILAFVRERILDEQLARMRAELDAREHPEGKLDQAKAKFIKFWRGHPKSRLAISVGLIVAGGAAAATGLGGVAIGAVAARGAMSGIGGYMYSKGYQENGERWFSRRKGQTFFNPGEAGVLAPATPEQLAAMSSQQRLERMAALLSAQTVPGRSEKEVAADQQSLDSLRAAESKEIDEALAAKAEQYFGANLVNGAMTVLRERVTAQMEAERARLQYDKRINRRHTFFAATIGVAAAAATTVVGLDHVQAASHAHHAARTMLGRHGGVGAPNPAEHGHELHLTQHALHADHDAPGHAYPEVVVDPVNAHETAAQAAFKHLNNVQEFHHGLDPEQKKKAVQRLAARMTREAGQHGPQWRYTRADITDAIFNRSS